MHFDETDIMIEAYAGESFDINTVYNSGNQTIGIWVDWDDNGVFGDDDERIFLNYGSSPQSTEILIPENIEAGNYRMRVRGSWGNHVSDGDGFACNEKQYGNSVDFTLTVLEGEEPIADCEAPEEIEMDEITENAAFVIGEPGMDPEDSNDCEVVYGPEGLDIDGDQGTSVIVEDAPFVELEDLDADTAYDVYVRTICEDDQNSDWTGPQTFTTDEAEEPIADCEAPTDLQIGEVTDTTAEVSWTPQGEETAWLVVYGETGADEEDFDQVLVSESSYTIEDLDPETDYDVYVIAVCDEDEEIYSEASETLTFKTEPMSVDYQIFQDFSFYPNPVENVLNLQANAQIEQVEIFNLLGQKVIQTQPKSLEAKIETEKLSSGIYLMQVSIDGNEKTFRVIKK